MVFDEIVEFKREAAVNCSSYYSNKGPSFVNAIFEYFGKLSRENSRFEWEINEKLLSTRQDIIFIIHNCDNS